MKISVGPIAACVGVAALSLSAAAPAWGYAGAAASTSTLPPIGTPTTRAAGLAGPLSLEVDAGQVSYVTQNFGGMLSRVDRDGTLTDLIDAPGYEVGAVSTRDGNVYYAQNAQDLSTTVLMVKKPAGDPDQLADLHAYEVANNPDADTEYGFIGLEPSCAAQIDPTVAGPPAYTGLIDSHPYASLALHNGVVVADAGGNDILRVGYDGTVSTVAVLPAGPPVTITAEVAAAARFPACVAGYQYAFESVPTDVEIGPGGMLYVSTLPGGPEDASLGARGSVYRVDPHAGTSELVATGFSGATGLAVSSRTGLIVVAELFGGPSGTGRLSVVAPGSHTPEPLIAVPSPSAVEMRQDRLFVTTESFVPGEGGAPQPIGKLTVIPLRGSGTAATPDDSADAG
jgi:hypothetical protein